MSISNGTVITNVGTETLLVDGSAHTQPISGTVTANLPSDNAPSTTVLTNANDAAIISMQGYCGLAAMVVTSSLTGTYKITPEVTLDGSTWASTQVYGIAGVYQSQPITLSGSTTTFYMFPFLTGIKQVRIRLSTAGSGGTATVTFYANQTTIAGAVPFSNFDGATTLPNHTTWTGVSTGGSLVGLRTPNTFKTVSATASGNTALWTPASGKKFRLMRYMMQITSNATLVSGAVLIVDLQDSSTTTNQTHSVFVPTVSVAVTPLFSTDWIDLGNGVLSTTANNILNINLSVALATGVCRVLVCGTEE